MAEAVKSALKSQHYNKLLKEDFVSNHHGSTIWEIIAVTFTLPIAVFTWSALQSRKKFFTPYTSVAFLADWLINCASVLACLTVYSNQPLLLNGLILLPAIAALVGPKSRVSSTKKPPKAKDSNQNAENSKTSSLDPYPVKPFVSMYRGSMMVITCVAILAVDFRAFPRRFAKVENWGTSLMDLGVGSFVFSAGVVSARNILKSRSLPKEAQSGLLSRLASSLRSSLALLFIGIARMISVKGVDYAVHVTEYGTHWNFFFTLGLLPPFVAIFQSAFEILPSYPLLALILASIYEILLDNTKLTAYIIAAPRENFISANREGIASFAGYLAIFLAGQGAGMFCLPREDEDIFAAGWLRGITLERLRKDAWKSATVRLAAHALLYTGLFIFSTSYWGLNLRVSRRLANLPYVLGVAAFNSAQLVVCILTEKFLFPSIYCISESRPQNSTLKAKSSSKHPSSSEEEKEVLRNATSTILRAFNSNGLAIFLAANLLTGLVNLTLPTLEMTTFQTMVVLTGYIGLLAGLAVALEIWGIRIKI